MDLQKLGPKNEKYFYNHNEILLYHKITDFETTKFACLWILKTSFFLIAANIHKKNQRK